MPVHACMHDRFDRKLIKLFCVLRARAVGFRLATGSRARSYAMRARVRARDAGDRTARVRADGKRRERARAPRP